jgi:predicted dehydrogenase
MIKASIVGCGKIAEAHAWAIGLVPGAELVGLCDAEELMARQLAERFRVRGVFGNVRALLDEARPDVVHITTPPQSHFAIARQCLEAGCHVYVEKPFTLNSREADELLGLAKERGLHVTVGNDEQFSQAAMRMRRMIRDGYLGGPPVHMEATFCYDLGDEVYAKAFLSDRSHWVRSLPGQLLQNIISHGLIKIVEYLPGQDVRVRARGFTSPFLAKLGERELIDELRVELVDDRMTTAYFTFSTQMRPSLIEMRIYGPKNGLVFNQDHHSVIQLPGRIHKSYAAKILPLNDLARQYRRNLAANVRSFLRREFYMQEGLRNLTRLFYRSIEERSPVPIAYRDILLTTKIMDEIFAQTYGRSHADES